MKQILFLLKETQKCIDFCDIDLMIAGLCIYRYSTEEIEENKELNEEGKKFQK